MKNSTQDPDFGATGQFELTGVYFVDKKVDATFATTLGMEHMKSLVLLGAGQAHLHVLAQMARHRRSDLDVTLVTPHPYQTFGAMVPGHIAGHYSADECRIPLEPLLRDAGARWISARCSGLDASTSSVMLDYTHHGTRPDISLDDAPAQRTSPQVPRPAVLSYNFLSIDTGAAMERRHLEARVPGAFEHALPVRPLNDFINRWHLALDGAQAKAASQPSWVFNVCVVGCSVEAIELVFALQQGLQKRGVPTRLRLVTGGPAVLPGHPGSAQKRIAALLGSRQIDVNLNLCKRVLPDAVVLDNGQTLPSDLTVMAEGAHAPAWLTQSGLALGPDGHILTNKHLQSTSHGNVFAAGDIAVRADLPAGRNGVLAMQAGPDLALNLLASVSNQPLNAHVPSERALNVIGCGAGHAVAHWSGLSAEGAWAWRWKERNDRAFVTTYQR